jgi:hypothetical protein
MSEICGIDKETFKQIFSEHWDGFKKCHPRYADKYYDEIINKMLGCGDPANGYSSYICEQCIEWKKVPFSCKSCFCLSCCKEYVDNWVSYISGALFEGVSYRHVVLTVPEDLRIYFYRDMSLLSDLMKCGVEMLTDAVSWHKGQSMELGHIPVIQTAGRSGKWNPHLHIIMTSGGLTKDGKWLSLNYIPFEVLHKKWQYYLFRMLKERVGTREIKRKIDELWKKYPNGLVAYLEEGNVPSGGSGLAHYLAKYVVSPPISLRRIIEYTGNRVRYWYNDHTTGKRQEDNVTVYEFIGRMVQHILPKGFQRIRYYGLQATCKAKKVKEVLKKVLWSLGRMASGAYKIVTRKTYRESLIGKDPLVCPKCGSEMMLWRIWHPKYGDIYDELEEIRRGKYEKEQRNGLGSNARRVGDNGGSRVLQLSLQFVWV